MLLQQGKAVCEYDELSHDTLNNQIVKATLNSLVKVSSLDGNLRSRITELLRWFSEVSSIQLKLSHFGQVNVHRNNSYYRLTLKLCELIYSLLMPTEGAGKFFLTDVVHDETRMSTVFEEFIREFYRTEAKAFRSVRREDIHWATPLLDEVHASHLPKMQTDATLRSDEETIIVDAKFYQSVFANFRDAEKVRSPHLYQMFAYLSNAERAGDRPRGVLIYPSAKEAVTLDYELKGRRIKIATVSLNDDWQRIEHRLLGILEPSVVESDLELRV